MIAAATFENKTVGLFGLGGSGAATLESLVAGRANVLIGDDNDEAVERHRAKAAGILAKTTDFAGLDALVLAPGVPLTHPTPHWSAAKANAAGVPIIGDLEIFARERAASGPGDSLVAITGTNGKSTTTALVAHLLRQGGHDVAMGGNIGTPALRLAPFGAGRTYVLECSSYQIDLAPGLRADLAVHLNLSPDHLDRHGSFERYAAIKERLIERGVFAIVGVDDEASRAIASRAGLGATVSGYGNPADYQAVANVVEGPSGSFDLSRAPSLRGDHNAQNAAAAIAMADRLGVFPETVRAGLESFPGLAHRMQPVAERGGVVFVNDSKATNADAARHALASFDRIRWIVGGVPKSEGIEPLRPFFSKVAKAYLIGQAAPAFAATLGAVPHAECGTLANAVARAAADAEPGDVVLLSPACASFDQFRNFEERGLAFVALARGDADGAREGHS